MEPSEVCDPDPDGGTLNRSDWLQCPAGLDEEPEVHSTEFGYCAEVGCSEKATIGICSIMLKRPSSVPSYALPMDVRRRRAAFGWSCS